jgi:hypothetical protein
MAFGRRRAAEPVFVNVYDLYDGNAYVYGLGLGAYHSGVEVYGVEYTFGSGGGVFSHPPKEAPGSERVPLRESILLGETHLSEAGLWWCWPPVVDRGFVRASCVLCIAEIKSIVDSLRDEFHGSAYNVLTKYVPLLCSSRRNWCMSSR